MTVVAQDDYAAFEAEWEKDCAALECLEDRFYDMSSLMNRMKSVRGVSRSMAEEAEALMPGIITKQMPLNSFTSKPSLTNYNIALESVGLIVAGVVVAIIVAIVAMWQKFFDWLLNAVAKRVGIMSEIKEHIDAINESHIALGKLVTELDHHVPNTPGRAIETVMSNYAAHIQKRYGELDVYKTAKLKYQFGDNKLTFDTLRFYVASQYQGSVSPIMVSIYDNDSKGYIKMVVDSVEVVQKQVAKMEATAERFEKALKEPDNFKYTKGEELVDISDIVANLKTIGLTLNPSKLTEWEDYQTLVPAINSCRHEAVSDFTGRVRAVSANDKLELHGADVSKRLHDLNRVLNIAAEKIQKMNGKIKDGKNGEAFKTFKNDINCNLAVILNYNILVMGVEKGVCLSLSNLWTAHQQAWRDMFHLAVLIRQHDTLDKADKDKLLALFPDKYIKA